MACTCAFLLITNFLLIAYAVHRNRMLWWERRATCRNILQLAQLIDKRKKDIPIVFVLTCTATPQNNIARLYQRKAVDRISTYTASLTAWLDTGVPVVILDNSGFAYSHLAAKVKPGMHEILAFHESETEYAKVLVGERDKGVHELYAIRYAYDKSVLLQRANFIVKVTGRFFVPEMRTATTPLCLADCPFLAVRQNSKNWCQIVGCRWDAFGHVFGANSHMKNPYVERLYRDRILSFSTSEVFVLPKLRIPKTPQGGRLQDLEWL